MDLRERKKLSGGVENQNVTGEQRHVLALRPHQIHRRRITIDEVEREIERHTRGKPLKHKPEEEKTHLPVPVGTAKGGKA